MPSQGNPGFSGFPEGRGCCPEQWLWGPFLNVIPSVSSRWGSDYRSPGDLLRLEGISQAGCRPGTELGRKMSKEVTLKMNEVLEGDRSIPSVSFLDPSQSRFRQVPRVCFHRSLRCALGTCNSS